MNLTTTYTLLCIGVGALSTYYAQPYVHNNPNIIVIVITVFTVFAGFLIAVVAIIGDPAMIREGSWRIAELGRDTVLGRLILHIGLFLLYLVTIALLFVAAIFEKISCHDSLKLWIERSYLFFGVTSFLLTFALPFALLSMQRSRYDVEIERRRRQDGIPDAEASDEDGG